MHAMSRTINISSFPTHPSEKLALCSAFHRLPPELRDMILDFLHDDRPALKSCSLVSRVWLPTTRSHLFRSIQIRSTESCVEFVEYLDALDTSILSSLADLRLHVCRVIFADVPIVNVDMLQTGRSLSRLSKVTYLELRRWSTMALPPDFASGLSFAFPRLTSLHLNRVKFKDPHTILSLLHAFPRLSGIRVLDYRKSPLHMYGPGDNIDLFVDNMTSSESVGRQKPQGSDRVIDTVYLVDTPFAAIIARQLTSRPFSLHLRQLHLSWNREYHNVLSDFLKSVRGSPLEDLRLSLGQVEGRDYPMLFYDLSQLPLTNLKHLHLGETNLCWCRPSAASDYDYLWIVAMLHIINGNSTCASLARLTISVDPNIAKPPAPTAGEDGILSVPGLDRLPWHLIDRGLAALLEKSPALKVVFLVRAPNELEKDVALAHFVQHMIVSRLPRSRAKSSKYTIRCSMDGSNTVQYVICPAFGDAEATEPSLF